MDLSQLNTRQREAVLKTDGPLLVLAGAGSGKTKVITHKIAYLILGLGSKPIHIFGATFTNKAASEMKLRIETLIGKPKLRGINLGTFHSLCVKILRSEIFKIGYQSNFSILSDTDQQGLLKEIAVELGYDSLGLNLQKISSSISKAKNLLMLPESLNPSFEDYSQVFKKIYTKYQTQLKAFNILDFDDLIMLTTLLLKDYKNVHEKYSRKFRYILVDEYQDTNPLQYELVRTLSSYHKNITAVGDDDQSIYAWRGADKENILRFEKDFPDSEIIVLDQNYRCTNNILSAANSIIKNNVSRHEKNLWSNKGDGEKITFIECDTEEDEAEKVVDRIVFKKIRSSAFYSDFAILFRTNFQVRVFETACRQKNIPYKVVGAFSFFDRKEIRDVIAYLKVINNQDDDISLLRIINFPRRGIGETTVEHIRNLAGDRNLSIWKVLKEIDSVPSSVINEKIKFQIDEFVYLIEEFKERFKRGKLYDVFLELIEFAGIENALYKIYTDIDQAKKRIKLIYDFAENIKNYVKNVMEGEDAFEFTYPSLYGFLLSFSLIYDNKSEEKTGDRNQVTLLTLHSAKGLEFPHVFIVGFEDGVIPHENNPEVEEERRLCYVGFTRAMESLTISSCKTRKRYQEVLTRTPSKFLTEIPEELLIFETADGKNKPKVSDDEVKGMIEDLKKFLDSDEE